MGMFDTVKCLYRTPWPDAKDVEWQTKDTDAQCLDNYEIREDGSLWHEEYDPKDRSDTRVNRRWVQEQDVAGQLEIYGRDYTIFFWFKNGLVKDVVYYKDGKEVALAAMENKT